MDNNNSGLSVVDEKDRANNFISSILFSRATIFHPAARLTPTMKSKLINVVASGGTNLKLPLESVNIKSYGKDLQVDLHVDYLLQAHRDILETMLAYAKTIQLDDESYNSGGRLTWEQILDTVLDGSPSATQKDGFDTFIDRELTVLSMSMYELTQRLGIASVRKNYNTIEQRIIQLSTAHLVINELDSEDNITNKRPLSFIQDYRFHCDRSKFKSVKNEKNLTNHVFIVPDKRLLLAIRDQGYYYRLEQHKMVNYKSLSVRSFLKFITTHKADFLHTKKLDWAIKSYVESIASPVSHSFKSDLKKTLMNNVLQIEKDFKLQFREVANCIQIFNVAEKK